MNELPLCSYTHNVADKLSLNVLEEWDVLLATKIEQTHKFWRWPGSRIRIQEFLPLGEMALRIFRNQLRLRLIYAVRMILVHDYSLGELYK